MIRTILILLSLMATLPATDAYSRPFQDNERLKFKIRWGLIPAGEVTIEVQPCTMIDNLPADHFVLTARTYPVVDLIYKLEERIDSYVYPDTSRSLLYKKKQTGNSQRDIIVTFDWQQGFVQYSNFGQKDEPIKLLPGTIDPLSALYFIRQQDLSSEIAIKRPVTDGRKLVMGNASILGRERLTLYGKTYETIKLEPDMQDVQGVFTKSKDAKMTIWVTADDRKMLVKLKSKVVVGSFVAELVEDNYRQ